MSKDKTGNTLNIVDRIKQLTNVFFPFLSEDETPENINHDFNAKELDAFHQNSLTVSFIYNHKTTSYDYFSPNVKEVMGYDNSDFQKGGMRFAMSLVHEDHVKIYNRHVLPIMFKYYSLFGLKGKIKALNFSYTFRIKKSNGEYMWALHYMNTIKSNKWGLPALTLVRITDVTNIKKDDFVDLTVSLKENEKLDKTLLTKTFYTIGQTLNFSERELEVLTLMAKGKQSKEIAEILCISKHTVSTHRKNMMEKAAVKNSYELIDVARKKGLIFEALVNEE